MTDCISKTMMFCYNSYANLNADHFFCANCGMSKENYKSRDYLKYSTNENDVLTYYFYLGYKY